MSAASPGLPPPPWSSHKFVANPAFVPEDAFKTPEADMRWAENRARAMAQAGEASPAPRPRGTPSPAATATITLRDFHIGANGQTVASRPCAWGRDSPSACSEDHPYFDGQRRRDEVPNAPEPEQWAADPEVQHLIGADQGRDHEVKGGDGDGNKQLVDVFGEEAPPHHLHLGHLPPRPKPSSFGASRTCVGLGSRWGWVATNTKDTAAPCGKSSPLKARSDSNASNGHSDAAMDSKEVQVACSRDSGGSDSDETDTTTESDATDQMKTKDNDDELMITMAAECKRQMAQYSRCLKDERQGRHHDHHPTATDAHNDSIAPIEYTTPLTSPQPSITPTATIASETDSPPDSPAGVNVGATTWGTHDHDGRSFIVSDAIHGLLPQLQTHSRGEGEVQYHDRQTVTTTDAIHSPAPVASNPRPQSILEPLPRRPSTSYEGYMYIETSGRVNIFAEEYASPSALSSFHRKGAPSGDDVNDDRGGMANSRKGCRNGDMEYTGDTNEPSTWRCVFARVMAGCLLVYPSPTSAQCLRAVPLGLVRGVQLGGYTDTGVFHEATETILAAHQCSTSVDGFNDDSDDDDATRFADNQPQPQCLAVLSGVLGCAPVMIALTSHEEAREWASAITKGAVEAIEYFRCDDKYTARLLDEGAGQPPPPQLQGGVDERDVESDEVAAAMVTAAGAVPSTWALEDAWATVHDDATERQSSRASAATTNDARDAAFRVANTAVNVYGVNRDEQLDDQREAFMRAELNHAATAVAEANGEGKDGLLVAALKHFRCSRGCSTRINAEELLVRVESLETRLSNARDAVEERRRWETWLSGETQRMEREKVERDGRIALERGEMERAIGTLVEAREAEELERDEREAQLVLTANAAIGRERAAKEKAEREMVDATERGQELPRALERRGWDLERESETLFQRERAVGAVEAEQATQAAQALAREAELQSEIAHVREALRAERDRARSTSAGAAGDAATAIKACRERDEAQRKCAALERELLLHRPLQHHRHHGHHYDDDIHDTERTQKYASLPFPLESITSTARQTPSGLILTQAPNPVPVPPQPQSSLSPIVYPCLPIVYSSVVPEAACSTHFDGRERGWRE